MSSAARRIPYGTDASVRKRQDLERSQKEQSASRGLAASEIGNGGTLKVDGSLNVTGSISVPGTLSSAGAVTAGSTVTAGTSVSAGTTMTSGGDITSTSGTFWSIFALNNPVVSGYFALYVNGDGRFGRTVSARRYKQDIQTFSPAFQAAFALQLREFRLKQAVEEMGDAAPVEHGLIAEELLDLGLDWLVLYGSDGQVEGIAYEKVALALIPAIQELARVQADHEERLTKAGI